MVEQIQKQVNLGNEFLEVLENAVSEGKISNWRVISKENKKQDIYVGLNYKVESVLESDCKEFHFIIYRDLEDEVEESSFSLSEGDNLEKFKSELEDSIFICSQSKSKKYELPSKDDSIVDDSSINYEDYYDKQFLADFDSSGLILFYEQKLDELKKIIEEENSNDDGFNVKVNAVEFINSVSKSKLETSKEIKKSSISHSSYLELILTAKNSSGKESEFISYQNINDIYKFDFDFYFRECVENVIVALSQNSAPNFRGEVILSGTAAKDFFVPDLTMNSVLAFCGSRIQFLGISDYKLGDKIIDSNKEKLTVWSNPLLVNSSSSAFDSDGVSARKVCMIKESVFENHISSKQYGDYLGVEATGPVGPFEIGCGRKNFEDFMNEGSDKKVEIVSFSSFVPDMVSGNFSAEIRLGFVIENGIKTPFKGGLFNGNIFEVLKDVEFSNEKQEEVSYIGPKHLKFFKGDVVGLD